MVLRTYYNIYFGIFSTAPPKSRNSCSMYLSQFLCIFKYKLQISNVYMYSTTAMYIRISILSQFKNYNYTNNNIFITGRYQQNYRVCRIYTSHINQHQQRIFTTCKYNNNYIRTYTYSTDQIQGITLV